MAFIVCDFNQYTALHLLIILTAGSLIIIFVCIWHLHDVDAVIIDISFVILTFSVSQRERETIKKERTYYGAVDKS